MDSALHYLLLTTVSPKKAIPMREPIPAPGSQGSAVTWGVCVCEEGGRFGNCSPVSLQVEGKHKACPLHAWDLCVCVCGWMASGFLFPYGLELGLVLDANLISAHFCLCD